MGLKMKADYEKDVERLVTECGLPAVFEMLANDALRRGESFRVGAGQEHLVLRERENHLLRASGWTAACMCMRGWRRALPDYAI